jgi:hypothetical protein
VVNKFAAVRLHTKSLYFCDTRLSVDWVCNKDECTRGMKTDFVRTNTQKLLLVVLPKKMIDTFTISS